MLSVLFIFALCVLSCVDVRFAVSLFVFWGSYITLFFFVVCVSCLFCVCLLKVLLFIVAFIGSYITLFVFVDFVFSCSF